MTHQSYARREEKEEGNETPAPVTPVNDTQVGEDDDLPSSLPHVVHVVENQSGRVYVQTVPAKHQPEHLTQAEVKAVALKTALKEVTGHSRGQSTEEDYEVVECDDPNCTGEEHVNVVVPAFFPFKGIDIRKSPKKT